MGRRRHLSTAETARNEMDNLRLAFRLLLITAIFSIDFLAVGVVYALGLDGSLGKDFLIPFGLVGPLIGMTNALMISVSFHVTK